jgi:parallel beta-helix repeat protein
VGNWVENNHIYGIAVINASNNNIEQNNLVGNYFDGIWVAFSSNYNIVCGNNVTENGVGIELSYSSDCNEISGSNITMNKEAGIAIGYSARAKFPNLCHLKEVCRATECLTIAFQKMDVALGFPILQTTASSTTTLKETMFKLKRKGQLATCWMMAFHLAETIGVIMRRDIQMLRKSMLRA